MSDDKAGQANMDLGGATGGVDSVEKYAFSPIKGYPMLNWRGKRPFTSTRYYPAQLKEVHGEEVDGWRNKIFWGDNLQVMSHLLKEFRGKVDLIYIDPPFDSRVDYSKKIQIKSVKTCSDQSNFEEKQYTDIWSNDEYLQFMFDRIILIRELMSEHGIILVHVDWHKIHQLRCLLDEVFGAENFLNEIIWKYDGPGAPSKLRFGNKHDTILRYCKKEAVLTARIKSLKRDEVNGAYVIYDDVFVPETKASFEHDDKGKFFFTLPRGDYGDASIDKLRDEGRIKETSSGIIRIKYFVKKVKGGFLKREKIQDVWSDIASLGLAANSFENTKYPTQKPERLLERLIASSSAPGDLVLDCFMGSGTTQVAALKLRRIFLGSDINLGAVQITKKRLIKESLSDVAGFEIHNVNNYEAFRNPAEANELLLAALEIQKLDSHTVFDGEKDGRMVKIMPVNRLATRADLNELVAGFDYKAWERRQGESPNRAVEKITLVCMGHEPDLSAHLILAAKPYKIDVEVVDILRDKADLEFKRDSDAKVTVKGGELIIERFYPMNLLQKLSMQKEAVDDWRELTESILIDWNYDGAVLQPAVVDIPETKTDLVIGRYKVPADAGTVRVKITDLLSESWEGNVTNG